MAAEFSTSGGNTTITATWTAPTQRILKVVSGKAHEQWDRGAGNHGTEKTPVVWEDLSNQDKLDIWFEYVTMMSTNDAKAYDLASAKKEVEITDDDYDLGQ